ncbi:hypothetical protein U1Q18_052507 [Sarracenia purpurea var. burkii]
MITSGHEKNRFYNHNMFNESLSFFSSPTSRSPPQCLPYLVPSPSVPYVPPLQVYTRRPRSASTPSVPLPASSSMSLNLYVPSTIVAPLDPMALPIALCKCRHSCTSHPIT